MPLNEAGKLERIAEQRGVSLETLMANMVEEHKTPYRIAVFLGVYPNAVRQWLVNHSYQYIDGEWVKVEQSHAQ